MESRDVDQSAWLHMDPTLIEGGGGDVFSLVVSQLLQMIVWNSKKQIDKGYP